MIRPAAIDAAIEELARAGFLAPVAESAELAAAADGDEGRLADLVARRTTGEPLAWITGTAVVCGETIVVHPGVYVPRPQTEAMIEAAARLLPPDGTAIDLCTGSGAIAVVLARRQPGARVIGLDLDPLAVANARANGIEAHVHDLADPLPAAVATEVDLVVGVVPYVPTEALHLLPSDVTAFEPRGALDGGPGGTVLLGRAAEVAAAVLAPGGWLLLELGGDQATAIEPVLADLGFTRIGVQRDDEADIRSICARRAG